MHTILTLMLLPLPAGPAAAPSHEAARPPAVHLLLAEPGFPFERLQDPPEPARPPRPGPLPRPRPAPRVRQDRVEGPEQTERTSRTFTLDGGVIDLSNIAGDITITRAGGNTATVDIVKRARARTDEEAKALLESVQVVVTERNNRVSIEAQHPRHGETRRGPRRDGHVEVAYSLAVPGGTRVRAHSISGGVTAKDVRGELSLESVSGGIRVAGAGRVAVAKSISGDVELTDVDSEGALEAASASGTVTLRRVKARSVEAGSVSGSVVLEGVEALRVEGQTVSGEVRFSGPLARSGRYELSSHSGSVHTVVTGGSGFDLEATSFSGNVRTEFPVQAPAEHGRRRHGPRTIETVVGDGSAVLELTTFSGDIVISKR